MSDPVFVPISKPRGCLSCVVQDLSTHWVLKLLAVRPERQRQGVGSEAVRRVQRAAKAAGRQVWLVAAPKTIRFYRRLGFELVRGRDMRWTPEVQA